MYKVILKGGERVRFASRDKALVFHSQNVGSKLIDRKGRVIN